MPASESGRGGPSGRIGKQSVISLSPPHKSQLLLLHLLLLLFLPPTPPFHRFPLLTLLSDLYLPLGVFAVISSQCSLYFAPAALNTNLSFCHPSYLHNVSNARRPTECFSCHHSRISRLIVTYYLALLTSLHSSVVEFLQ